MGTQTSLGFIGAGNLAGSVIRGLLRMNFCAPIDITAGEPNAELRETLARETGITVSADNLAVIRASGTILLGLKPSVVLPVIKEIADALRGKLVISLAAGIRLASMEEEADARFLRVMTNTPSAIGRGATAFAPGTRTTMEDLALTKKIFGAIGVALQVKEEQIDAVTALAGSGPAFVYSLIEALAEGGKQTGLPADVALALATQTVLGASELASESDLSPEELRRKVITPGGTTAAGLDAMKEHGTREGLIAAVQAAAKRGAEMSQPG
ncbi:MAG TPA: pyrroline-5-carboxylate reductase [Chthoniobacterales bacterium]|nr:pyrroline-5-carboxylate reductase [Chthoniobacterales bacterium]